jgi:ribosomal-protein-alanine N-acetyltransferase
MDFCPCIEIGWRLDKIYCGKGYATEGTKACLKHGFENLGFDEVASFTSIENIASQRVMQKIGLQFERYFNHPKVAEGHPLRPHVFYRINTDNDTV